jgi:hypothetical protein
MDVDRSDNKTDKLMDDGKSFDLLIENASHSFKEFKRGYRCAAGGGRPFGVSEQKIGAAKINTWTLALLPSAHWWSLS